MPADPLPGRYPLATAGAPKAWLYGTHDPDYPLALIYHTTETGTWAGFGMGRTAPHHSYKPTTREWRWHQAPVDQRVGTMRSSLWTRTPANEKAHQLEIVAYSDRRIADQAAHRIWVGDFTEDHYRDLAGYAAWIAGETDVDLGHVMTVPPGGWTSGSASPWRLDQDEWLAFDGLGAHGGVTGQSHWDTGVLDLARIARYALESMTDRIWLTALQRQTPAYFETLQAQTGHPGGRAGYWGESHDENGNRIAELPSDEEWTKALPELAAASLQAGAFHPAIGAHGHPELAAKDHPHTAHSATDTTIT